MCVEMIVSTAAVVAVFIMAVGAKDIQKWATAFSRLKDKNITSALISTIQDKTRTGCAVQCVSMSSCESFFYNVLTRDCQLHGAVFSSDVGAADQEGMEYYYITKEQNGWCPVDQGFKLLAFDSICIKFHPERKSWYDANDTCASYVPNYGRLAVLDTLQKYTAVTAAGEAEKHTWPQTPAVWIGLYEYADNSYKWIDGKELTFTNWDPTHKIRTEDDSILLVPVRSWLWYGERRWLTFYYLCEVGIERYHAMVGSA